MKDEQFRYLFTVRQSFNKDPKIDGFYQITSPSGMSGEEMQMMTVLSPNWKKGQISADTLALKCMTLRLRFNSDMFQKVCMVRATAEIALEDLESYIAMKYNDGDLDKFLNESAI
jgi:hypothetical protein